jgi:hypothetical protein
MNVTERVVTYVPIALWLAALLGAAIAVWFAPRPITLRLVADKLLRYLFIFPLGVQGLWAFLGHVFLPEDSAAAIGWAPSPFQFEVGVANLGIALASFYAAFKGYQARGAVAVAAACFLGGAGVGHLIDIALGDNFAAGNAGPILITDFLTPIAVLALLVAFPPVANARVQAKAQQSLEQRIAATADKAPAPRTENAPRRIEDELEQARVSMRDQFGARPTPEVRSGGRPFREGAGKSPRRRGPGRSGE